MISDRYEQLDHMIALAARGCLKKEEERLNALDTENVRLDRAYYRKRARTIKAVNRRPAWRKAKMIAVRVAVALLALILLGALAVGSIPGIREALYKVMVDQKDDHMVVTFEPRQGNEINPDSETGVSPLTVSDPPKEIQVYRKPSDLPPWVQEEIAGKGKLGFAIDYWWNEELYLIYSQSTMGGYMGVDNTNATVTEVLINGNAGILIEYSSESMNSIIWTDGEYRYTLESEVLSADELIALAENVK